MRYVLMGGVVVVVCSVGAAWTALRSHGTAIVAPPAQTAHFAPDHQTITDRGDGFWILGNTLSFWDAQGQEWKAPQGTVTDGASIPQVFFSVTGAPLDHRFFNAAVVHDAFCGSGNEQMASYHTRPWREVHRMFYEAMLVCGTSALQAKIMYAAVYLGGPRWQDNSPSLASVPNAVLVREMESCKQWIEKQDPSLPEIDRWMDGRRASLLAPPGDKPTENWK